MIIDSHTHILPPDISSNSQLYSEKDSTLKTLFPKGKNSKFSTAEELISSMNSNNINLSFILGMGWTDAGLNSYINDYLIESSQNSFGKLLPLIGITPHSGAIGIKEAERCLSHGIHGFGEIHSDLQKFDITSHEVMAPYMELLSYKNMPIVIHASEPMGHQYPGKGSAYPEKLWEFVSNFPDSKIILSHWGGGAPFYELMPEVSKAFRNVYYDCAATPYLYTPSIFETVVNALGHKKIVFGSDYPIISQEKVLKDLEESSLNEEFKDSTLFHNAKEIFNL